MRKSTKKRTAHPKLTSFADMVVVFLRSKAFFRIILALAALQGIWYAFSFSIAVFDETHHFEFIRIYADRINPFISSQPEAWDIVGDTTRNGSYLYYYLMSFPFRFAQLFTDSLMSQIIFVRLFNVAFFILGLVVFDKFFREIKISKAISRVALLIIVLTPSIAPLPGAMNYDNVVFLFVGLLALISARIIQSKKISARQLIILAIVVCIGSLFKSQFLAIAVPALGYLTYDVLKNKKYISLKVKDFVPKNYKEGLILFGLILSIGLFIERPVYNALRYGDTAVPCIKVQTVERCKVNYTQKRNIEAKDNRPKNFKPKNIVEYTAALWTKGMYLSQTRINPANLALPIMIVLFGVGFYASVLIILSQLKYIWSNKHLRYMLIVTALYVLILIIRNYISYKKHGRPVAVTSRYLLPVMPFYYVLLLVSFKNIIRGSKVLAVTALLIVGLIFTQGWGFTSYLLQAEQRLYWPTEEVEDVNTFLLKANRKYIIEYDLPHPALKVIDIFR